MVKLPPVKQHDSISEVTRQSNRNLFQIGHREPLFVFGYLVLIGFLSAGCQDSDQGHLPTVEVSGIILVDQKPQSGVVIQLVPVPEDPLSKTRLRPGAVSDSEGNFNITTYSLEDGAPDGKYNLIFFWPPAVDLNPSQPNPNANQGMGPPDQFAGKYFLPEDSSWEISIQGDPMDLGALQLNFRK